MKKLWEAIPSGIIYVVIFLIIPIGLSIWGIGKYNGPSHDDGPPYHDETELCSNSAPQFC